MNLSALTDFDRVASAGGLGKASRETGRPKATLSRRIRLLEDSLGVRLIERGHHALRLTAEGQRLYDRTHRLLHDIEDIGRELASGATHPSGQLRVSAPALFSDTLGGRLAAEFNQRYPDVRIEWVASDRQLDLVAESFDVVIRVNPRPDSDLVGRCFAHDRMLVVASPSLPLPAETRAQAPATVPAVALTTLVDTDHWAFTADGQPVYLVPDYRLRLSSLDMIRDALRAGAGAALLPRSLVQSDIAEQRLVLWGDYPARQVQFWALHSSWRLVSPKVSAFVDFLVDSFPSRQL